MNLAEPIKITQQVAHGLEKLGIQYLVCGSLASSLHGIPRATHDVDMVADIKNHHVRSLVKMFAKDFYIDETMIFESIKHRRSFNIIHLETMFKVDIFILKPDFASQQEMKRREQHQVSDDNQVLYLASAEDVLIHKLYWFDMGGRTSERQWNDIVGIVQVQHDQLDHDYLKRIAQLRNVSDLLEQLFQKYIK